VMRFFGGPFYAKERAFFARGLIESFYGRRGLRPVAKK
jgi:hypothetical protein